MTPRQVIERWVETFNRADADALAELYADDAVNHQVAADWCQRDRIAAVIR